MNTSVLRSVKELFSRSRRRTNGVPSMQTPLQDPSAFMRDLNLPPGDPLLPYLLNSSGAVEIDDLKLDSPTLASLKAAGMKMIVPLISQGDLIGMITLGPRRSEQNYSIDDRRLLSTLATQAAPALRVAQLARQQFIIAREREQMEQELRIARAVQQTLLPKEVPVLDGWKITAHWQPARAVSGDFYDFIEFPDDRLGLIVADVTDKGVPAALVMASSRSVLRSAAEQLVSPGAVLERANNLLCPSMPGNMFVTCLYAVLDLKTGALQYANAGHNPPYQRSQEGVRELMARGMPLGLIPDSKYEEQETRLVSGDHVMLYSDGLIEAHNPQGEMFGFPRMRELMQTPQCGEALIECMLHELNDFTGPTWEQEDDVTFVTLEYLTTTISSQEENRLLAEFELPSHPGGERQAMQQVSAVLEPLISPERLQRLQTAVAEATMNAMEHGNQYQAELPVHIQVWASDQAVTITIRDQGGGEEIPETELPDLEAKLSGLQSPRGWGLFLIQSMVDEMKTYADSNHHTVELIMRRADG